MYIVEAWSTIDPKVESLLTHVQQPGIRDGRGTCAPYGVDLKDSLCEPASRQRPAGGPEGVEQGVRDFRIGKKKEERTGLSKVSREIATLVHFG